MIQIDTDSFSGFIKSLWIAIPSKIKIWNMEFTWEYIIMGAILLSCLYGCLIVGCLSITVDEGMTIMTETFETLKTKLKMKNEGDSGKEGEGEGEGEEEVEEKGSNGNAQAASAVGTPLEEKKKERESDNKREEPPSMYGIKEDDLRNEEEIDDANIETFKSIIPYRQPVTKDEIDRFNERIGFVYSREAFQDPKRRFY